MQWWKRKRPTELVSDVVPDHRCVIDPWQLDIACARNMLGEKSSALYIDGLVIGSVNDEGGHPERPSEIPELTAVGATFSIGITHLSEPTLLASVAVRSKQLAMAF
jgi:hypothetical protein